jgi:MFS family permease
MIYFLFIKPTQKNLLQLMNIQLSRTQWKIISLSSLGGALEFYDFIIFAIFAANIGAAFFPATNPFTATLSAFAAFAIGYLVRPIGGILFSHFGDRYGRKNVFIISMSIMASATFLMSITPNYHSWGITATIIFMLLRLGQGMAIGGEIPGAITFVKEHVNTCPGFACGIVFLFINAGIFLADLAYGVLNKVTTADYAWRIAFFIGGILAILSYFLRRTLHESQEFNQATQRYTVPLFALIRHQFKKVFLGFLIVACQATLISLLYLYVASFMKLHDYSIEQTAWISGINLAIFSLGCAFWGWVSDYIGAAKVMIWGILLSIPLTFWFYHAILTHQNVMLAYVILSCVCSTYTGSFSAYLASLFPVNVRFSGVAFTYNLGFAIFGGLTPFLATYLIKVFDHPLMPAYVFLCVSLLGIIGIIKSRH